MTFQVLFRNSRFFLLVKDIEKRNILSLKNNIKVKKNRPKIKDENELFIYAIWQHGFYITRKIYLFIYMIYIVILVCNAKFNKVFIV